MIGFDPVLKVAPVEVTSPTPKNNRSLRPVYPRLHVHRKPLVHQHKTVCEAHEASPSTLKVVPPYTRQLGDHGLSPTKVPKLDPQVVPAASKEDHLAALCRPVRIRDIGDELYCSAHSRRRRSCICICFFVFKEPTYCLPLIQFMDMSGHLYLYRSWKIEPTA
jgi:hypothetical protein